MWSFCEHKYDLHKTHKGILGILNVIYLPQHSYHDISSKLSKPNERNNKHFKYTHCLLSKIFHMYMYTSNKCILYFNMIQQYHNKINNQSVELYIPISMSLSIYVCLYTSINTYVCVGKKKPFMHFPQGN